MPRGDKQQIMKYPICIPTTEYFEQFNQIVSPMLETVFINRLEINNLSSLRDALLPKLMSGEIDVSAITIQFDGQGALSFLEVRTWDNMILRM